MVSLFIAGAVRSLYSGAASDYPLRRAHISHASLRFKIHGLSLLHSTSRIVRLRRRGFTTSLDHDLAGPNKSSQKTSLQNSEKANLLTQSSYPLTWSEYGSLRAFVSFLIPFRGPSCHNIFADIALTAIDFREFRFPCTLGLYQDRENSNRFTTRYTIINPFP